MDIIHAVKKKDKQKFSEEELSSIFGKGYSDVKIINGGIERIYNTNEILRIVKQNNCKVYSTWGKGSNLKNWEEEISKINFTANLVSPSPVARVPKGASKRQYILNDWSKKIIN